MVTARPIVHSGTGTVYIYLQNEKLRSEIYLWLILTFIIDLQGILLIRGLKVGGFG